VFEFGTDFGLGSGVWIDGNWYLSRTDNLWWGGSNWNHNDVFKIEFDYEAGLHTITIIEHENCCDGPMDVRANKNNVGYTSFNEVPEVTQEVYE
jgi:hypothetical protein